MTEYNLFCYAEKYNDEDSFQQPRRRVFNKQITQEEYKKIEIPTCKLEFDSNENYKTRYKTAFKKMRTTLTPEQKQEYFDIPHFNREIFTKITGVEQESEIEEMTVEQVCKALGKNIKIVK